MNRAVSSVSEYWFPPIRSIIGCMWRGERLAHSALGALGAEYGVEVMAVAPESPAARGGIWEGDVIVATDGHELAGLGHIHKSLRVAHQKSGQNSLLFAGRSAWRSRFFRLRRDRRVKGRL